MLPRRSSSLLHKGDVFLIEVGQKLYVKAHGLSSEEVSCGEATCHQEYRRDMIVVEGKKYYSESKLVTIQHVVPPPGEYKVLSVSFGGGGHGGGMNGADDYPDGHRVEAKLRSGKGPIVSFYQSGCFTAMLEKPKVISRA